METTICGETNACVILWQIQNVSHCWLKEGEQIKSPSFVAHALDNSKWSLWLLPFGSWRKNNVEVRLHREKNCSGPDEIEVNYKLAFLQEDGSLLKVKQTDQVFSKDFLGYNLGENRRKIFVSDRKVFLPGDTLKVKCTICNKGETPAKSEEIFIQTVLKVKGKVLAWKIDKFSTIQAGVRSTLKDDLIKFDFFLKEGLDFDEKLVIDVISCDEIVKYILLKIYLINSEGKKEYYGSHEYFEDDLKIGILPTLLTTRTLMENKSRYLANDILSLDIEYLYSTGTIADEFCSYGIRSKETPANIEQSNAELIPVLVNDLKSMYIDSIFSDAEIRTSNQTFPVHKCILSARSPVFRRNLIDDMRDNNTGSIDMHDLENDIVQLMLIYIYTGSLEDLRLENARKLYVAADEYEILPLKSRCSSFLKENLHINQVCDILVFADLHQDNDLKKAAENFILKHNDVFSSTDWKNLMSTHL